MIRAFEVLGILDREHAELERRVRAATTSWWDFRRARIVLLRSQGLSRRQVPNRWPSPPPASAAGRDASMSTASSACTIGPARAGGHRSRNRSKGRNPMTAVSGEDPLKHAQHGATCWRLAVHGQLHLASHWS